jgi:hypothetical protein
MALPIERRNGHTTAVPAPRLEVPANGADLPVTEDPAADVEPPPVLAPAVEAAAVVDRVPSVEAEQAGTEVPVPGWVRGVTTLAVVLVALVAAVVSYEHMRALADLAGEGWRSRLLPISVDGLVVAGSMTMLVRRRAGQPAGALTWAALVLGLGASLAANVVAADPGVIDPALLRRLVAGWPPLALLLAYELLMQQLGRGGER